VRRAWTQSVFRALAWGGKVDQKVDDDVAVKLVQMNYRHTSISTGSMLIAAEQAGWDADAPPFRKMLDLLGDQSSIEGGLYALGTALLREVWRRPLLDQRKELVTLRVATRLVSLRNGPYLITRLIQETDEIFGLDIVNARRVRTIVQGLLETRKPTIIIP
jgi:hypothetical protein